MHMRICSLLFVLLLSGTATAIDIPVVKSDRTVTLQQVEGLCRMDACTDLTKCDFIGKEFDVRIVKHDSITSVLFPDRRYDFKSRGDTVLLVCEENRTARLSLPTGLELTTGGIGRNASEVVTGHGRYRQTCDICAELSALAFPATASTLITLQCDTLRNIRLDHLQRTTRFALVADTVTSISQVPDSAVITSTVDTYSLSAVDEAFPRVLKHVKILSGCNGSVTDSATYILVSDPVRLKSDKIRHMPERPVSGFLADGETTITVTPDGGSVTVTPSGKFTDMSLSVCDMSGRVLLTEKISGNDSSVIDISSLPKGEYLIQASAGDKIVTVVKHSNRML